MENVIRSVIRNELCGFQIKDSLIKLGYPDYMMNDNTLNQVYAVVSC